MYTKYPVVFLIVLKLINKFEGLYKTIIKLKNNNYYHYKI